MSKILTTDSWDCMLPGPPSRNNFGSADLSSAGLLAFASGSSISVVDAASLQLIATVPLTSPSSSSPTPTPFVTAIRWTPQPLRRDLLATEPSSSHLIIAVGDRHGRISLIDFRLRSIVLTFDPPDPSAKAGIQDLCWAQARHDSVVLAAITGPSLFSIYNTVSSRCIFKYDASPELLSCVRRDPFDSRHMCVIGLKGFFLSVKVLGDSEKDIAIKEFQIRTDCTELSRLERDAANAGGLSSSPASAVYPQYHVKFVFSPIWKHVIYVTFPRELVVFDLQYQTRLFSVAMPRGSGKFLDVLHDPNHEVLYCVHLDGKISIWRRKEGEQVHVMCMREELIPSIATSVPSPSLLAALICQPEATLQNVSKLYSGSTDCDSLEADFDNHFDFYDDTILVTKTRLVTISDDGKIWSWLLTAEGVGESDKETANTVVMADARELLTKNASANTLDSSNSKPVFEGKQQLEHTHGGKCQSSCFNLEDITFKISLVQQLQLLSSTVTMLAVPTPSLTATLARGGNHPALAVPLVALGTNGGTVDVVDVSANAIAASFMVHSSSVRGLRWLGNSRLVSFSYTQASERTGGYINKLVVTCVRSGLNRPFRVLQKPERAPIRALRASSSGRYLMILFRDAPVEVWAMSKNPIMLRSLALGFTVLEWTLPTVPRPTSSGPSKQLSSSSKDINSAGASDGVSSTAPSDSKTVSSENSQEDISESFAFALVNGAVGVFEFHGRRIRDFRPKWPSSSFVSSDGLITAMAYRLPHVVMGDRSGNIRWWDVTTGQSSSFNTHRDGIRRIKFSPVVPGDRSRGRIAVLFYDNTFSVFDLDSPDPLANSLLQRQFPGTLVLELDWLPLRTDKNDPLVLCIAGADGSFRLVEVNINDKKGGVATAQRPIKEKFRPMPLCCPILLPVPHALALRMILQLGVKPSWFNTCGTVVNKRLQLVSGTAPSSGDLRSYMIELPPIVDSVVPELLLNVLEPYRKEGCILDDERARLYATIVNKGSAPRFAFAAAIFGEISEALFWLRLPHAIGHLMNKMVNKSPQKVSVSATNPELDDTFLLSKITSKEKSTAETGKDLSPGRGQLRLMAFEQAELWENANQRISWHEKLEGEEALQNRVHELVLVGNLEAAVSLLLTTSPDSSYFYPNALRAVALSSAVSISLHELAVKVVAANMVRTDRSLSGIHLLCAVGRHQEACSQLQDAGFWTDAATLAATYLKGSDYARVLKRWAGHVLHTEHNLWRALLLYVAAGAMQEALAALREAQLADTAAMFIVACREIHAESIAKLGGSDDEPGSSFKNVKLRGLEPENADVIAVVEYFGQYQNKLVHLCVDAQPFSE